MGDRVKLFLLILLSCLIGYGAGYNPGNGQAPSGAGYNAGGDSVKYGPGYTPSGHVTAGETVTYNGNSHTSGTAPTDATQYAEGATVTVSTNSGTLARTNYVYDGWNTAADGSGTARAVSSTFAMPATAVTLYAHWLTTYTVTYAGNDNTGGSVPADATRYTAGTTVTCLTNSGVLTRTGYTFNGWNTATNGSGTAQATSSTFTMGTGNVTLYAQWVNWTVAYNGNGSDGGTVPVDGATYATGDTITTLTNSGTLVRSGYAFSTWNTAANGSGTAHAPAAEFAMAAANVTLYAQWSAVYSVTYDGNGSTGGTVPVDAATYAESATVTVLTNSGTLVNTGYTFNGWNTLANGTGTARAVSSEFAIDAGNVTLYAKWEQPGYNQPATVLLHMDGSDDGTVFTDNGALSRTISRYGDTVTKTAVKALGSASAYFDGTGDYLSASGADLNPGTGNFTISARLRITVATTGYVGRIAAKGNVEVAPDGSWCLGYGENGGWPAGPQIRLDWRSGGSIGGASSDSVTLNVDTWYHVEIDRSGTTLYFFVNGVAKGSASLSADLTCPAAMTFGSRLSGGGNTPGEFVTGYLDEVIVITGTALHTSGFDSPTVAWANGTLPGIASLTPATGPTAGGTSVVIAGTRFTAASAVTFCGTAAASYNVDSDTQITATTAADSGSGYAVVTTAAGVSANTAASVFTYADLASYSVSGAGDSGENGTYVESGTLNSRISLTNENGWYMYYDGIEWVLSNAYPAGMPYHLVMDASLTPPTSGWSAMFGSGTITVTLL